MPPKVTEEVALGIVNRLMSNTDDDKFRHMVRSVAEHVNFADSTEAHMFFFEYSTYYRGHLRKILFNKVSGICKYCKRTMTLDRNRKLSATFDHVYPQFHGGTHHVQNLQVICMLCNSRKGEKIHFATHDIVWQPLSQNASKNKKNLLRGRAFGQIRGFCRKLRIAVPDNREIEEELERNVSLFSQRYEHNKTSSRWLIKQQEALQ